MVATTTSTQVRVRPSRDGSERSSIIRKTPMQSRSMPASTRYTRGSDNCTSWHCITGRRCMGMATCWTSWTAGPTIRSYKRRRPRQRSSGLVEEYGPVVWAKTAVHNNCYYKPTYPMQDVVPFPPLVFPLHCTAEEEAGGSYVHPVGGNEQGRREGRAPIL
jgi:hypothetical protein